MSMFEAKRGHIMAFYGPMILTIMSITVYQLIQKATPATVHPLLTLAISYATATVVCLLLLLFFPLNGSVGESLRQINWVSFALAFALVGIEFGFLWAYRVGWNLSLVALVANVTVTMLLLPVGVLLFSEHPSWQQLVGIGVCILGLVLINWR